MRSDTLERSITSRQLVSFLAQFLPPLFFLSLSLLNFFFFIVCFIFGFALLFHLVLPCRWWRTANVARLQTGMISRDGEINEFLLGARPFFVMHRIMDANRM